MREILYRGKRLDNGDWAYGVPLFYSGGQFGIVKCTLETRILPYDGDTTFHYVEELFSPKVDPATVGQYTGLADKNGVKIFEGDIVVDSFGENKWAVQFFDGRFWGVDVNERYSEEELGELADLMPGGFEGVIVIGNIHDNPDLIKGR